MGRAEVRVAGLGDLAAFGADARPRQGGFGSGRVGFRGGWPGGGVTGEKGSSYDRNAAGRGISAQYGAGQGEFWAGSSGFVENVVDSGGWRPSMARNWAGLTQFGADFGVKKLKMLIF